MPCRFSLDLPLYGLGLASKWCHVGLALICHGSLSKGHGSNLWLSANRTVLFHWTLDIRSSSKVTLNIGLYFFLFLRLVVTCACKARHWCSATVMTVGDVSLDDHIHSWYVCIWGCRYRHESLGWACMVTLSKIHYMPGNPMEGMSDIYKSPILV